MHIILYFLLSSYFCILDAETTMNPLKMNTTSDGLVLTNSELASIFTNNNPDNTTKQGISVPSYPTLKAHTMENLTELHVGMVSTVRLILTLPPGYYEDVSLYMDNSKNSKNFDIHKKQCNVGKAIHYRSKNTANSNPQRETGFGRKKFVLVRFIELNAFSSDNNTYPQLSCDIFVFFHNAEGLVDGEKIKTKYGAEAPSKPVRNLLKGALFFTARTSLLSKNKRDFYEVDSTTPNKIKAEIKIVTKIIFKAWIPYYNPRIKVHLSGQNTEASYLKVRDAGEHFYPGAAIKFLETCNVGYSNNTLQFPAHWVNRGYYDSENTTDDDIIVFEAGVALSEMAIVGTVSNITISVFIDDVQVWTSTFELEASISLSNSLTPTVSMKKGSSDKLSPTGQLTYMVEIGIPGGRAGNFNFTLLTKEITEQTEIRGTPLYLENIVISGGRDLVCWSYKNYTQTESSASTSVISLGYLNGDKASTFTFQFDVIIDPKRVNFNHTYVLSVNTGEKTIERNIILKNPSFFQDKNMMILSTFHQVIDDNITTCFTIPLNGEDPPVLLTRIQTSWFGTEVKAFNVIIKGKGISCYAHGKRNLLVSFPATTMMNNFQGYFETCDLISEDETVNESLVECSFRCNCKDIVECSELILFMANKEKTGGWEICELNVQNV